MAHAHGSGPRLSRAVYSGTLTASAPVDGRCELARQRRLVHLAGADQADDWKLREQRRVPRRNAVVVFLRTHGLWHHLRPSGEEE